MKSLQDYFDKSSERPANLAERLGVEPSTITRILKGERRPSVHLARKISDATGVAVADLRPDIFCGAEA